MLNSCETDLFWFPICSLETNYAIRLQDIQLLAKKHQMGVKVRGYSGP